MKRLWKIVLSTLSIILASLLVIQNVSYVYADGDAGNDSDTEVTEVVDQIEPIAEEGAAEQDMASDEQLQIAMYALTEEGNSATTGPAITVTFNDVYGTDSSVLVESQNGYVTAPDAKNFRANGIDVKFEGWETGEGTALSAQEVSEKEFKDGTVLNAKYTVSMDYMFFRQFEDSIVNDKTTEENTDSISKKLFTTEDIRFTLDITNIVLEKGESGIYRELTAIRNKAKAQEAFQVASETIYSDGECKNLQTVEVILKGRNVEIPKEPEGTDSKFVTDWYVIKLEADGWHVDGRLVDTTVYPLPTPTSTPTPTPTEEPTATPTPTQVPYITPFDLPPVTPEPTATPTPTPEPTATPTPTEEPTATPTPVPEVIEVDTPDTPEGGDTTPEENTTEEFELPESETPAGGTEEEAPETPAEILPKAGTAPVELFYGLGGALILGGCIVIVARKKREAK